MRLLFVVTVAAAGCSKPAPAAKPCERGAKIELRVVDNDSDYMKHVFAHVGSTRDGAPTDQTAIDAGIRADIDQWQTDIVNENGLPVETKRERDYFLVGSDRSALETYLAAQGAPPADREVRFEHGERWRTYYVNKTPVLDTTEIADVVPGKSEVMNKPILLFTLTREGQAAFAKSTAATVGKKQVILVDGEVMSAPVINGAIKGGRFSLNLHDQATADALLAKFRCVK